MSKDLAQPGGHLVAQTEGHSLTCVMVGVVVLALKETDCLGQTFPAFSSLLLLVSGNDAASLGPC